MADDPKKPIPGADAQALKMMPRLRRELVQRKQQVDEEVKGLQHDLAAMQERSPLKDLNNAVAAEVARQEELRREIAQTKRAIRSLQARKQSIAEERAKTTVIIRELQQDKALHKQTISSKDSSPEEKEFAKQKIADIDEEIPTYRTIEAEQSKKEASYRQIITRRRGVADKAEVNLSESLRAGRQLKNAAGEQVKTGAQLERGETRADSLGSRVSDLDEAAKARRLAAAERITPASVASDIRRRQPIDPDAEARTAGQKIREAGGFRSEQKDVEKATKEFTLLVDSIKTARKELANLSEGTEEYSQKQGEIADKEARASAAMTTIMKTEAGVADRGAGGGGLAGKFERGGQMLGGALRFGADMAGRFGDMATSRFTIEEERKNAQLRVRGQQVQDTRNRATDATAFLSTGGAGLFGGEGPYEGGKAKAIGEDFANTQRAIPQLQLMLNTAAKAAELTGRVIGAGVKGEAINPITGSAAALGELAEGGSQLGISTIKDALMTPEFTAGVGGAKAAEKTKDLVGIMGGAVSSAGQVVASTADIGGKKAGEEAAAGVGKIGDAITTLGQALPAVVQRANEAVNEMTKLTASQEELTQIQKMRERLSIAFAPQVQKFLDQQPAQLASLRSRVMSPAERTREAGALSKFATDEDLGARGFGPEDITRNTTITSQTLGRFGAKGANMRISRQAMEAESMGLGSAEQSIGGMGKLLRAGAQDPSAMFEKAVTEGMMRGIQDSHQFQEMLSGISEIAQNTGEAEGALQGVLRASGSGRGDDMKVAIQGFKDLQERMSGKSGTWMDIVKHSVTQQFAGNVLQQAKKQGVTLDKDDLTTVQGLTNYKPEELRNKDLMNTVLTPNVRKVIEGMDKGRKPGERGALDTLADTQETRGTFDQAITSTQSKELLNVRQLIENRDKEGLQARYGSQGKQTQEQVERLQKDVALLYSGASGYSDTNDQAANAQRLLNDASDITGNPELRKSVKYHAGQYEKKNAAQAAADARAANNMPEQQNRGGAEVGAADFERGQALAGTPEAAAEMGRSGQKHRAQLRQVEKQAMDTKTVAPAVIESEKVQRLDEAVNQMIEGVKDLVKAMKDFSFKTAAMSISGDVVVQGAQAIKGVLLDNAASQAISKVGTEVADAVMGAVNRVAPAPQVSRPAPGVTVPSPQGSTPN